MGLGGDPEADWKSNPTIGQLGRTRFQKIAYFASEQGLPLGLDYQKGSYGPFSPALKALVTRLINNGLIREQRLGKMFAVKVGQTYQDAYKAYATYLKEWEHIIEKTSDLFMRMDTNQAEIAATVLYAARSICDSRTRTLSEKGYPCLRHAVETATGTCPRIKKKSD